MDQVHLLSPKLFIFIKCKQQKMAHLPKLWSIMNSLGAYLSVKALARIYLPSIPYNTCNIYMYMLADHIPDLNLSCFLQFLSHLKVDLILKCCQGQCHEI